MANTSPSRKTVQAAPQSEDRKLHVYVPALIGDDFGRLSTLTADTANPFVAKKLGAASQRLQRRAEEKLRRDQRRDYILMVRSLQIEFLEAEQERRRWGRLIKTRVRPEKIAHRPPQKRKRTWPYARSALPHYPSPILDRKGERGVFVRIFYYSRKNARPGVSSRVVKYVFHGAELDAAGRPYFLSNVGRDVDEAHCAFDHLEQINGAAQKNAKLLMHAIMAADYRQAPDEMMRTGVIWAEKALGRFGLPYVVTLHAPPPDGDPRNWHLHILFSFRPLARVSDHEWEVGEMLRTDLDNPQAMRLMREMYASVMTISSYESGINQTYTARSNAARGLVHEPQVHLGGALTNMARNGHHVAKNEENFERVMRSQTAALDEELRHIDQVLAKEQETARAKARRWMRMPAILPPVPQRIMASLVPIDMPVIAPTPHVLQAIIAPAIALPLRSEVSVMAGPVGPAMEPVKQMPADVEPAALTIIPEQPPVVANMPPLKIANLRFAMRQVGPMAPLPAMASSVVRPSVPEIVAQMPTYPVRATHREPDPGTASPPRAPVPASIPPILLDGLSAVRSVPHMPQPAPELPMAIRAEQIRAVLPLQMPSPFADIQALGLSITYINGALEDHARREDERAPIERARQIAAAKAHDDERRRLALQRLIAQIVAERRAIERQAGKRRVAPELIERHGLSEEDIAADEAQAQLERIAAERAAEAEQLARIARAVAASSTSLPLPEDRPAVDQQSQPSRPHALASWLRAARQADRMAARDDDPHWTRRDLQDDDRPAERQVDVDRPQRPPIMPQGRDR
ncbi:hypothetical protein LWE61_08050 [Sphingobium sufflavum]|uniref:hypothetical protein n=1 Tax=Sphingobium sufflavum TaxID=1129547 RepID=UPI001F167848|nr:hypothetical protein [Sphingobium sufflavum]MCE7796513.1 hypothetical protein [Sphingobium sufflavum]